MFTVQIFNYDFKMLFEWIFLERVVKYEIETCLCYLFSAWLRNNFNLGMFTF